MHVHFKEISRIVRSVCRVPDTSVPVIDDRKVTMHQPANGTLVTELPPLRWQKSRRSNPSGNCVELASLPGDAGIAVRNSRFPEGPALVYTMEEIAAFVHGARDGDFDNLIA
jgi:hypothetical protein